MRAGLAIFLLSISLSSLSVSCFQACNIDVYEAVFAVLMTLVDIGVETRPIKGYSHDQREH